MVTLGSLLVLIKMFVTVVLISDSQFFFPHLSPTLPLMKSLGFWFTYTVTFTTVGVAFADDDTDLDTASSALE